MIVRMRSFESRKHTTYAYASGDLFEYGSEFFRCLEYCAIIRFRYIGNMIYLDFRNDQDMSRSMRIDIEKSVRMLIFIDFV